MLDQPRHNAVLWVDRHSHPCLQRRFDRSHHAFYDPYGAFDRLIGRTLPLRRVLQQGLCAFRALLLSSFAQRNDGWFIVGL